jgi:hypothetical protein
VFGIMLKAEWQADKPYPCPEGSIVGLYAKTSSRCFIHQSQPCGRPQRQALSLQLSHHCWPRKRPRAGVTSST